MSTVFEIDAAATFGLPMLEALLGIVFALYAFLTYRTHRRAHETFRRRGVDYNWPWPIIGESGGVVFRNKSLSKCFGANHKVFPAGIYGSFHFDLPLFVISDLAAIKQITITDYTHFIDHRPYVPHPDVNEPLFGKSLFMLTGDRWRDMRTTLSPAFTGSKLRRMFPLVTECCVQYMRALSAEAAQLPDSQPYVVEMKDVVKRYQIDVIASTAFGYQIDSWRNRHNIIYTTAMETMHFNSSWNLCKMGFVEALPRLAGWLGVRLIKQQHVRFYHDLVHEAMAYREREGIVRPDMIHLLAEARKGFLRYEAERERNTFPFAQAQEEDVSGMQKRYWDEDDVTAQCYYFFFAGAENSATLLSFIVQEMLENSEVQVRLRAELDEARGLLAEGETSLPYDKLMALPYLEMVVMETLRKWPPTGFIDRLCVKDFTLTLSTGQTVDLRAGETITVPLFPIHRDGRYFVDPDRFDPERFGAQRKHEIDAMTFLSLGMGPRNCIGWRYAMMTVKSFVYHLLTEFRVEVCTRSQIPAEIVSGGLMLKVKGGICARLRPRN